MIDLFTLFKKLEMLLVISAKGSLQTRSLIKYQKIITEYGSYHLTE